MTGKQSESCISCKITAICCLLGIGGYLFYQGKLQCNNTKYVLYLLGSCTTGLGIGEIFNKSPFQENK